LRESRKDVISQLTKSGESSGKNKKPALLKFASFSGTSEKDMQNSPDKDLVSP
jgi:hypothetical protein